MTPETTLALSIVLVASGLCGVVVVFWPTLNPRSMDRFSRRLGLSRSDRRLLRFLAKSISELDPLPLLVGRGCFEKAVSASELDERTMVRVESLRARLFSEVGAHQEKPRQGLAPAVDGHSGM